VRVEMFPDRTDLLHLGPVELPNHASSMPIERDQTFGGQVAQRLSDRRGADIELGGEIRLDQPSASGEVAPQDGSTQGLSDELMRRPPPAPIRHEVQPAPLRSDSPVPAEILPRQRKTYLIWCATGGSHCDGVAAIGISTH